MSLTRDLVLVQQLERLLASRAGELAAKGMRAVSLVGSRPRGTARPQSDISLLIDVAADATF